MQNMSRFVAPFLIAASVVLASGAAAQAQTKADDSKANVTDWNAFLCKDIMRMSGDERIIALSLLNGYYMGKKGAPRTVPDQWARRRTTSPNTAWTTRRPRRWSRSASS